MSLTNMQYDEIIRSYNRIGLENKRRQNERIAEVYEAIPRIREINDEISSISVNTAKHLLQSNQDTAVSSSSEYMSEFKARLHALKSEKLSLLEKNGFSADYMDMHYQCSDCQDTGYIGNRKCHCFTRAEIEILYRQSNLREQLAKQNFDSFNISLYDDSNASTDTSTGKTPRQNMLSVLSLCHHFVDNFGADNAKYHNLLLFGKTGVGKTFLTHCIARELLDKAFSVIYLSSIHFFQ